jgi:hypothetical protein
MVFSNSKKSVTVIDGKSKVYGDENPYYCCGYWYCSMAAIPSTIPSNYCQFNSNVGQYPLM